MVSKHRLMIADYMGVTQYHLILGVVRLTQHQNVTSCLVVASQPQHATLGLVIGKQNQSMKVCIFNSRCI